MEYAVFLRAINVGRANRIRMDELKTVCARAALEQPVTYLQSGNLVLSAKGSGEAVATAIEEALAGHGLKNVSAMVRSREELEGLVADFPSKRYDGDAYRRYVTFLRHPAASESIELPAPAELVALREREVLSVVRSEVMPGPDLNGIISRELGVPVTTRYWHVAEALLGLMRG